MPYHAQTTVLTLLDGAPQSAAIGQAAQVLRAGGLVAFPTETVYGLGANALDPAACARIFAAKERPTFDPLIVHLASADDLPTVARDMPAAAAALAAHFWPGALTLVLPRGDRVPDVVTASQPTVAVRVPSHPVAQALIRAAGVPVAAPSANRFSRPSPTTADHVLADLAGRVDMVLDGGPAAIGVESTILDLTGDAPRVLRPGGVSLEALRALLPGVEAHAITTADGDAAPAPGTLLKHYSPDSEVILFSGPPEAVHARMIASAQTRTAQGERVLLLGVGDVSALHLAGLAVESLGVDATEAAHRLFAVLRRAERHTDVLLVRAPQPEGLGLALWDRLWRAAEGRLVRVE